MANENIYGQQVMGALYPTMALPQTIRPVTKTQRQAKYTQYDPETLAALKAALSAKRPTMSRGEIIANALANTPEARSFTGGFGEEIISPWAQGLSSFARGFGSAYGAAKANQREVAEKEREDAIKIAEIENEAKKQAIAEQVAQDYMKVNDPNAKTAEQIQQQQNQKAAALDALHTLKDLGDSKKIWAGNNETTDWWLSSSSSENIGKREQALSTLIPMTNTIARASGGSGINTLGEMMAYLGIPENATSAQIRGALPGIIKKLGLEEDFYQMSPVNKSSVNGFTIEEVK